MKELKRVCIEEIKKDILAGKIDGMPTTSATGFASNKRQSNMTTIVQTNKDSKQNNSAQTNFESKGELKNNQLISKKQRNNSKSAKDVVYLSNAPGRFLNPALNSKIKKIMEKQKKLGGYVPKSMEQTIVNEKKVKIQENLDSLFKGIKNKQSQHLRHQSFNYLQKK